MYKKIKNISFLVLFSFFLFLILKYYFSEENIILTSKLRSSHIVTQNINKDNLPILENDTSNIIIYKNDIENLKKKKKKRFWEKLISNKNE